MTTEVLSRVAERIVLHDGSWATYEQLLANYEDAGSPRFAYDRGVLEIMILSAKHEKFNDVFKLLVNVSGSGGDHGAATRASPPV